MDHHKGKTFGGGRGVVTMVWNVVFEELLRQVLKLSIGNSYLKYKEPICAGDKIWESFVFREQWRHEHK